MEHRYRGFVGLGVFVLAIVLASAVVWWITREPVSWHLVSGSTSMEGTSVRAVAEIALQPNIRMTFDRVEGELSIAERNAQFDVQGLEHQQQLFPGNVYNVRVSAQVESAALVSVVIAVLGSGSWPVRFEGMVRCWVMGIPVARTIEFKLDGS